MPEASAECVLDAKAGVGECPLWCELEQALYWVDIYPGKLNRFDPSTGRNQAWTLPEPIGSFALCLDGAVLVALKSGLFRFDLTSQALESLACPEAHPAENRLNDGRCDRQGRFWVGSMQDPVNAARPAGTLYRFGPKNQCEPLVDGLFVSNGLAFSPDGTRLYHSDSYPSVRTIWSWDIDPLDGSLSNRQTFVDTHGMAGRPDGGAVDADGCYWMAANDGWEIVRFSPAGKVDRRIGVPVAKPTMLAFGGPRLDVIYVTSIRPDGVDLADQPQAGGLFAIEAGVTGLPEPRFAG